MCGRFALPNPEEVAGHFGLKKGGEPAPRFNIAPSQGVAAVRLSPETGERELTVLHWGLIPFWAEDRKIAYRMINARGETVAEKPAFRAAFKQRRCLIPALGFYEWEHKSKTKQPYFVRLADAGMLAFAGLWEHWQGEEGEVIESCTIITTGANSTVARLHDRMPVIVGPADYDSWLDPRTDKKRLLALVKPFAGEMVAYPVGKGVNNPKNDEPRCLEERKDA